MSKPFTGQSIDMCPSCHLIHPVKTVHLWLDDSGACIVSQGVLEDLRKAGMPDLETFEEITNPPPLEIGVPRAKQDQASRALIVGRR